MIKVSVCCITYGHEQYLTQAIESVMAQAFNGVVEMVIGEDCSPDGTRAIALAYQARYPTRIKVLTPTKNLGVMVNLTATLAACDGDYIAILDGDDYWTDPNKLQRQVDALQANPDCAFCFHDAEIGYEPPSTRPSVVFSQHIAAHALPPPNPTAVPLRFTQLDLARVGWIAPTASLLFRASSLPQPLPAWFVGVFSGDYTLQLLSARHGEALYLPRIMAHYRLHEQSITVAAAKSVYQFERRIYEARMFQQHVFDKKDKKHADIYLALQCRSYASYLGNQGQRWQQIRYSGRFLFYNWQRVPLFVERRAHKVVAFFNKNQDR
jgi:glycosyltransferase involved in cell wall biosynthesis